MDELGMIKRKSIVVGDIFQILTSEGVCYGQVIHTHPKWKFVIAIFREFFPKEPDEFDEVVNSEPQFITTFLIQDAIRQGFFTLITNAPVAKKLTKFPVFRGTNHLNGDQTIWFFWDGHREWKVHRPLTDEEKRLPEGPSFPSAALLIEMIENDYRVERDYI